MDVGGTAGLLTAALAPRVWKNCNAHLGILLLTQGPQAGQGRHRSSAFFWNWTGIIEILACRCRVRLDVDAELEAFVTIFDLSARLTALMDNRIGVRGTA